MFSRLIMLTSSLLLACTSLTEAQTNEGPFSKIDAFVETHGEAPFVGEPLRLVIKSAIHAQVASDRIIQPDLTNFDWQQFGVDTVKEEFIDGFWMPVFSRVLMIYPLRPGRLTIDPFKRHITYFGPSGDRVETEITSKPLIVDVRSHESLSGTGDFWIPARNFVITDEWTPEPDHIPFGEITHRTLTLEADGLTADRLPNLPSLRAPGIITFAGPVKRETIITDHGPLGRAIYRWRIRPASQAVAVTPMIKIRWFDILTRQMREYVIPERRVSFLASGAPANRPEQNNISAYLSGRSITAFVLAFLMTAASGFLSLSLHFNDKSLIRSMMTSLWLFILLSMAARHANFSRFYNILNKLKSTDSKTWKIIDKHREYNDLIHDLEARIFSGRQSNTPLNLQKLTYELFKIYLRARLQPERLDTTTIE